jgi:hypothetical protein
MVSGAMLIDADAVVEIPPITPNQVKKRQYQAYYVYNVLI